MPKPVRPHLKPRRPAFCAVPHADHINASSQYAPARCQIYLPPSFPSCSASLPSLRRPMPSDGMTPNAPTTVLWCRIGGLPTPCKRGS
uniref:Uncharacterized protein n=1 Tax=Mycena chlorophos TaxID=658473 RepID=A0ABQ0M4B1_MYCCL|nr:predicted protein [Mycena chlorophos]